MPTSSDVQSRQMFTWIKKNIPEAQRIRIVAREASNRSFFRLEIQKRSYVLMVYPSPAPKELDRIQRLTALYSEAGLRVAGIQDRISDQALLMEDLGEHSFQFQFKRSPVDEKKRLAKKVIEMAQQIASISAEQTFLEHDLDRQRYEMDFFLEHYLPLSFDEQERDELKHCLYRLIQETSLPIQFSHRDYHSRNLICSDEHIGLVDFQDSMRAHPLYDLASFLWDAYISWPPAFRIAVLQESELPDGSTRSDLETVALQRTIKALGTFAFQVKLKKNMAYARYIPRVSDSILQNPQLHRFIPLSLYKIFQKNHWRNEHDHQ